MNIQFVIYTDSPVEEKPIALVEMDAVPRRGDDVTVGTTRYEVAQVHWRIGDPDLASEWVIVRLR